VYEPSQIILGDRRYVEGTRSQDRPSAATIALPADSMFIFASLGSIWIRVLITSIGVMPPCVLEPYERADVSFGRQRRERRGKGRKAGNEQRTAQGSSGEEGNVVLGGELGDVHHAL
jgi:hypothetical protein